MRGRLHAELSRGTIVLRGGTPLSAAANTVCGGGFIYQQRIDFWEQDLKPFNKQQCKITESSTYLTERIG